MDKNQAIVNQLATNYANKTAVLEADKAILQVELNLAQQEIQELKNKLEEKEDENVKSN